MPELTEFYMQEFQPARGAGAVVCRAGAHAEVRRSWLSSQRSLKALWSPKLALSFPPLS